MALTVSNGNLLLDDLPCRHVGVNAAYLLARRWYSSTDTQHIETLDNLANMGIKVIRCVAIPNAATSGGGLLTWGTATGLSAAFYTAQDVIFDYAATKGIQIIPTLFSNYWSIANYKSEKLNQLGVTASAMRAYMRTCAAEYVAHYTAHSAIAGWEISNEWNNYAELQAYPTGNDYTGAAYSLDANNLITINNLADALQDIATTIRTNDTTKAILSGNAGPWFTTRLALDGYEGLLAKLNPSPIDTISAHLYSYPTNNVWCRMGYETINDIVGTIKKVGRGLGKPVIMGELGVSDVLTTATSDFNFLFKHLRSEAAAPLSLVWNFYKPGSTLPDSNNNYDFYTTGNRSYYVDAIMKSNGLSSYANREANSGAIPTKYLVLSGTDAVRLDMPSIGANFSLSFWARHDGLINRSYPRIISATSDESTNGFSIVELGTTDATFGEPYFRLFNGTAQSATLRTGPIQDIRWKQYTYVFKNWETTFVADDTSDILSLIAEQTNMQTGDKVRFTTTGTLPGGLSLATDYYVVKLTNGTCQIASGQGNAYLPTIIDITSTGSGTHTINCISLATYQNGLKSTGDNTTTFTGSWVAPTGQFVIGANRTYNGDFFKGHIAKVRLWQYGLTEENVWQDYIGNTPEQATSYLVDSLSGLTVVGNPSFTENAIRSITTKSISSRGVVNRSIRS